MQVENMTVSGEPHDRLTAMADRLTDAFDADSEHEEGDKCIIFLDDGKRAGLCIHGYEKTQDALVDLLGHLTAMFQSMGMRLDVMALDADGVTRA